MDGAEAEALVVTGERGLQLLVVDHPAAVAVCRLEAGHHVGVGPGRERGRHKRREGAPAVPARGPVRRRRGPVGRGRVRRRAVGRGGRGRRGAVGRAVASAAAAVGLGGGRGAVVGRRGGGGGGLAFLGGLVAVGRSGGGRGGAVGRRGAVASGTPGAGAVGVAGAGRRVAGHGGLWSDHTGRETVVGNWESNRGCASNGNFCSGREKRAGFMTWRIETVLDWVNG